eukprot:TRINITY_DN59417_c0_g1_i1.p1 TRINITY_DN59417_c0_g1~~TRINITY_DN59417_c0_g1_i1.p1  ORF type:complete len:228 (-),score=34.75 TRINITY_DN59417_c0_g1_i1:265-948(-)
MLEAASERQPFSSDLTDDAVLFWGRGGEAAMDKKADGAQILAVMTAFLTAFSTDKLLGLDKSSFDSDWSFTCYVLALAITCSGGFYSLLILTFVSVKLKRLALRSFSQVGEVGGPCAEELRVLHGGDFKTKVVHAYIGQGTTFGKHAAFHARYWYNCPGAYVSPRALYASSLVAFKVMCCAFLAAMSVKTLSALTFTVGMAIVVVLVTPTIVALALLGLNGAMSDLE